MLQVSLLLAVILFVLSAIILFITDFITKRSFFASSVLKLILGSMEIAAAIIFGGTALIRMVIPGLDLIAQAANGSASFENYFLYPVWYYDLKALVQNHCNDDLYLYVLVGSIFILLQGLKEFKGCFIEPN
jgi:hypothetical protein